ncbi:PD-(D/E)XK nuclease family protein [uncultured Granulicatella sp.]|uniref:PD-(D/E)XK nuclease family protein n=1 Tax=uncultured Granulicatella sp. TaxID=316089 RepID=UPI00260B0718|nr:PD-(D/E)XK nuclease family protein [uncultured Granulicatella sp.]
MGFKAVISKKSINKSKKIAEHFANWLKEKETHQVFYIVPDHIKFTAEMEMIRNVGELLTDNTNRSFASTRLQVYSFKRLLWYLLRNEAITEKLSISKVGITMLLKSILEEHSDELLLFKNEARHKGFLEQLNKVMNEFQTGGIEVEDFSSLFEVKNPNENEQRLKEFGIIYRYFTEALKENFIHQEESYAQLCSVIASKDLSNTFIVIDETVTLTKAEMEVIEALVGSGAIVEFHATLTTYGVHTAKNETGDSLFTSNRILLERLSRWVNRGEDLARIIEWENTESLFDEEFKEVEHFWLETNGGLPKVKRAAEQKIPLQKITFTKYTDEREEYQETFAQIKRMVQTGKVRYKDIQILGRNLEENHLFLESLLKQYDIPGFIDLSDSMEHHPIIQVLDALFAIWQYDWRYADIMSLLRSEYVLWRKDNEVPLKDQLQAFRQQLDETETVILANGYEGYQWTNGKPWAYVEDSIDEDSKVELSDKNTQILLKAQKIRDELTTILLPAFKKLEQAATTKEAVSVLYQSLLTLGVDKSVIYWRDVAAENGDIETARRQEQVWSEFIRLLDEYIYIFADKFFDFETFMMILHTGFEQTHYNLAPSTLDELTITGMDSVRYTPKKITFAVGLSQGVMPRNIDETGLLTDDERELFSNHLDSGRFLAPSTGQLQSVEPFVFYQLLMSATEKLYLSCAISKDGKEQLVSNFVQRLLKQYDIEEIDGSLNRQIRLEKGDFVVPFELFTTLLLKMRENKFKEKDEINFLWKLIPHLLKNDAAFSANYHALLASVFRLNVASKLPLSLAQELYGNQLNLSTSQIETYYKDPFSHFLQYGLRLKERQEFELSPANTGEYFHEFFDQFIKELNARGLSLRELTSEQKRTIEEEIFNRMKDHPKFAILASSKRLNFIQGLLHQTLMQTTNALQKQAVELETKPWMTEVVFGTSGNYPIHIPIGKDQSIHLRGKIDRIDLLQADKGIYNGIIDYKSSEQRFEIAKLIAGVQIQLLTYLKVSEEIIRSETRLVPTPLEASYIHVHNPKFSIKDVPTEDKFIQEWTKAYKHRGLVNSDEIARLNPELIETNKSSVLNIALKKDGNISAIYKNGVYTTEELNLFKDFVWEKIQEAGRGILSGDITLAPFEDFKQYADSVSGKFSSIAQFDATNPENRYRTLPKFDKEEGITFIQDELQEKKGETEA